jgi:hypothetical protein
LTWLKVSAPIDLEAQARHVSDEQVLPFAQKFFGPWSTLRDLVSLKIFYKQKVFQNILSICWRVGFASPWHFWAWGGHVCQTRAVSYADGAVRHEREEAGKNWIPARQSNAEKLSICCEFRKGN